MYYKWGYDNHIVDNERCKACKFFNSNLIICDYLERTGTIRGCPIENCEKFERADPHDVYKLSPGDFIFFGK